MASQVPVWRLYVLRALYLLIVVGLGSMVWPTLWQHEQPWGLMDGVVACMLTAFSGLALLGLRYPLQLLPILLWELAWKTLWLALVAWPLWRAGQMDAATQANAMACLMGVIIPFAIPWRYVWTHYVTQPSERWR